MEKHFIGLSVIGALHKFNKLSITVIRMISSDLLLINQNIIYLRQRSKKSILYPYMKIMDLVIQLIVLYVEVF